jgi:hypothetical protein
MQQGRGVRFSSPELLPAGTGWRVTFVLSIFLQVPFAM